MGVSKLCVIVAALSSVFAGGSNDDELLSSSTCTDAASCHARMRTLVGKLDEMQDHAKEKGLTLRALEELRNGILSGRRVDLPSSRREHLESGTGLISEISLDSRHKPISTNATRHFLNARHIAEGLDVKFHKFLGLKKAASTAQGSSSAILVVVDTLSRLSVFSLEGDILVDRTSLGHEEGSTVTRLVLSPSHDDHFVLTCDDHGISRMHALKIVAKLERIPSKREENLVAQEKRKGDDDSRDGEEDDARSDSAQNDRYAEDIEDELPRTRRRLFVTTSFSVEFRLPVPPDVDERKINTVLALDRGSQTYIMTGDTLGGIAVFHRNGSIKGLTRVTDDPGGVIGLLRGQGQSMLYYSSHSFGFFSSSQMEVQYPPCSGWNVPIFDVAADPTHQYSRVILGLSDGDVLVFSTTRGKSKACDLTLKFPHVSTFPFQLHNFRGHIMALETLPRGRAPGELARSVEQSPHRKRELFFFNLASMDEGYGAAPSRTVPLQVSFKPQQPRAFALLLDQGTGGDRMKSLVAMKFDGDSGLTLYDVTLKPPPTVKSVTASSGGTANPESSSGWFAWLDWFPKVGVFGIAMVGVVVWNVRKGGSGGGGRMDDFGEDYFSSKRSSRRK